MLVTTELALLPTAGVSYVGNEPGKWINRETGEVIYALVPIDRAGRGGRWLTMMQAAFEHLAVEPLPARTMRVLCYLLARLDFDNWIHVEQQQVAEVLHLDKGDVSRSIKQLVDRGIIHRGPRADRICTYRLDPNFGWRGTAKRHSQALAEVQRRGWQVVR